MSKSESINPHHFVSKPKISKKFHNQLRMDNRGIRNGSHGSGNTALRVLVMKCLACFDPNCLTADGISESFF